ncbi:MAG TPA: DUF748 domain-containing protein, partial [Terriglobales bacterium]|nr:DUF748 domain-containing protein [Terriglobales bacterium]
MGRTVKWLAVAIGLLVMLVAAASYFVDEPLRRRTEQKINQALRGYTVKITKLDFHPLGFSLDLEDAVIVQDAHPDPPVARIPNLTASVNWKALIFGRIVADFEIDNPKFVINLKNIRQEERDRVPIEKRGWQEALEAIYPLKINEFVISNADLTYIDQEPRRPLRLTKINFHAENIRNVRSKAGVYPSKIYLVGNVFDTGKVTLDGAADFLAEPHVTFKAAITLDRIQLDYFKPIIERHHFTIKKGVLSTAGNIEYALKKKILEVPKLEIRGVEADYIHEKPEETPAAELSKKTERIIHKTSNSPTLRIHMDDVDIIDGKLGVVNRASNPPYRVFFSHARVKIENLGNQSEEGVAVGRASAKFMGSGDTQITAHLRPRAKSP